MATVARQTDLCRRVWRSNIGEWTVGAGKSRLSRAVRPLHETRWCLDTSAPSAEIASGPSARRPSPSGPPPTRRGTGHFARGARLASPAPQGNRTRPAAAPTGPAQRAGGESPAPQGATAAAGTRNPIAMAPDAAAPRQSAPAASADGARAGGVPAGAPAAAAAPHHRFKLLCATRGLSIRPEVPGHWTCHRAPRDACQSYPCSDFLTWCADRLPR